MREENAELRKRLSETSSLETAKKKAEARAEQLEQKVRRLIMFSPHVILITLLDGRDDTRESRAERE